MKWKQLENAYFSQLDHDRNTSLVRRWLGPILQRVAERLHEQFPALTPDHLSILGALSGAIGALLAEKQSKRFVFEKPRLDSLVPLFLLANGAALDGLDGALARQIAAENPTKIDLIKGATIDSIGDYVKEVSMGVSKILSAHRRGNLFSKSLAYAATLSTPVSSLMRARGEAAGKAVPELGSNLIEFFGTRTGRTICNIFATVYPQFKKVQIQTYLDALIFTGNCANILRYVHVSDTLKKEGTISERRRSILKGRIRFHSFAFATTVGITLATFLSLAQIKRRHADSHQPMALRSIRPW